MLIHAESFPGWSDLQSTMAHMRFVESHYDRIGKLAIASDNLLLAELPPLIGHLTDVKVKHFPESAVDDASFWLEESVL